ncbi:FtsX-like permease family protein [Pasteuria penetrans]|uniref:FtsX-like permease family protein n=1 Tax=Pasteuria penetrans TaxID=86005 RepID=UPI000F8FF7B1|nr:FtsX-like permease family protein [Pasteuria penetrans]
MTLFSCVARMIRRRPQAYIGLLLNSIIISAVIFSFASFMFHPQLPPSREYQELMKSLFRTMFYILMFCSFFSVFYSLATLYRERQKQFGIFILMGIKYQQLRIILWLETMIIGGFSVVFGVLLGMVLNWGLGLLAESLFEYVALDFHFSLGSLGITAASSLAIFLLAALAIPFLVQNQKAIQLLQGKKRMDDKPEPAIGSLRALVSFLSLGIIIAICLFLPVDMNIGVGEFPDSIQYIFPICVLLTFVGTYLFYRQGSVALAKWFRWNRSFSWHGIRLLWMGNMAHRLRDNSRFFWFFSMLLLTVFTSVSVVVTIVKGVTEFTTGMENQQQNPAPLLIHRLGEEDRISSEVQSRSQWMDQTLLNNDVGLRRVDSTPVVRLDKENTDLIKPPVKPEEHEKYEEIQDKKREALARGDQSFLEEHTEFVAVSVNDYNKIMGAYGGELLHLKPNEAVALGSKQGAASNPLPRGLGAAKVTIPSLEKHPVPAVLPQEHSADGNAQGMYVLGDSVYSKLLDLQDPGILKLRDVNYISKQGRMNFPIFRALVKVTEPSDSGTVTPTNRIMDHIIHDGSQKDKLKWFLFPCLLTMLTICLVFVTIAGNFLLLRIYTDIEDQQQQFHNLLRIGFSIPNLQKSITVQISYIFFFPLLLAVFLAFCVVYYGIRSVKHMIPLITGEGSEGEIGNKILEIASLSTMQVIAVFLGIQMIIFLSARLCILRAIKKRITR